MIPVRIHAHLVGTGLGPLFDGVGHVVVTPEDLLPVIALALLAGLGGKSYGRMVLFVLPVAWLIGGLVGLALGGVIHSRSPGSRSCSSADSWQWTVQ